MKALFINSSHRANGNTAIALASLERAMLETGDAAIATIRLAEKDLKTCRGCRLCFDEGEESCPLKDDLLAIRRRIAEAEVLVLGSPVYVEDVNGVMKNWIDRMAFTCHRPAFFGKSAYVLSTSGGGASRHALATMDRALRTWGFAIVGGSTFVAGAKIEPSEFDAKYGARMAAVAGKLRAALEAREGPSFLALMTFAIQKMYYLKENATESYDFRYWKGKGWLEKERAYYDSRPASGLKAAAARIAGRLVARIFLR